jgi:hypothetical protein
MIFQSGKRYFCKIGRYLLEPEEFVVKRQLERYHGPFKYVTLKRGIYDLASLRLRSLYFARCPACPGLQCGQVGGW